MPLISIIVAVELSHAFSSELDHSTGGSRVRHRTGQGPLLLLTYPDFFQCRAVQINETFPGRADAWCGDASSIWQALSRGMEGNVGVRCFLWLEECGNGGVARDFCMLWAYVPVLGCDLEAWNDMKRLESGCGSFRISLEFQSSRRFNSSEPQLTGTYCNLVQLVCHTADMLRSNPVLRSWNFKLPWSTQTSSWGSCPS